MSKSLIIEDDKQTYFPNCTLENHRLLLQNYITAIRSWQIRNDVAKVRAMCYIAKTVSC